MDTGIALKLLGVTIQFGIIMMLIDGHFEQKRNHEKMMRDLKEMQDIIGRIKRGLSQPKK